jgi:hypothetical protein
MAEEDPSITVRMKGDTTHLDDKLKEAEKKVDKTGQNMGSSIDKSLEGVASRLGKQIAKMVGAGFAIKSLDNALRIMAEGIRTGKGADEIALAIGDSIVEGLRRAPIAGALGELLAIAFDPLFGGALSNDAAVKATFKMQMDERRRQAAVEDLLIRGGGTAGVEAKYQRELRLNQERADAAEELVSRVEGKFLEADYDAAVEAAIRKAAKTEAQVQDPAFRSMIGSRVKRSDFTMAAGFDEEGRRRLAEIQAAREKADAAALERRNKELEEAQGKIDRKEAEMAKQQEEREERDPQVPPLMDSPIKDDEIESKLDIRHDDATIFEGKLVGIATEQLTEIREMRRSLETIASRQNGFN